MEIIVLCLFVAVAWLASLALGLRREGRALRARVEHLAGRVAAIETSHAAPQPPGAAPAAGPAAPPIPEPAPLETVVVTPPSAPGQIPAPPSPSAGGAPPALLSPPGPRPAGGAPPPPPPPAARRPALDLSASFRRIDWERVVGVKLFSVLAGVAVAVAAAYFAIYSADRGWITPPIRFAILAAAGLALVVGSELKVAQGYRITAQSLAAGGVAALFTSIFAAHALWHLLPALATFGLLALVTAVAVLLSIRRSSLVVAVLGLLGGFATPILVTTGENQPLGLFGYLLLLNVALSWVSRRRRWPLLPWLSLALTAVYQAGWVARFLDRSQLPLALGIFLVFPLVGFAGAWLSQRAGATAAPSRQFRWAAAVGALPPALFALYLASGADLGESWPLLFGFLALVAAGLAAVAAWQGPEWLHLGGAATVLLALAAFLGLTFTPDDWPLLAALVALLAAIYLGAPLLLSLLGRDFRAEGRLGVLAAPLLLSGFAVAAHAPTAAAPATFLLPLLALAAAGSGYAVARSDARVHALSSAMAILAAASWSFFHLDAPHLYPALLAYAALGGLFLLAPLWAERRGRPLASGTTGPLLLGALALLAFLVRGPATGVAAGSLAGLAVLATLFEAALFREAARGRSPLLALLGVVVGFVVLALWAVTGLAVALLPALLAVAALSGVALAGAILGAPGTGDPRVALAFRGGSSLALAGHLFLLAVAAQERLALPSAPWLALLGVLDLAFLAAALLRRRADLLPGAAAATVVVLLGHVLGLNLSPPATDIAAGAAVAAAALFLAGYLGARHSGAAPRAGLGAAGAAALVALHGGQLVLLVAGSEVPIAFLVPAHLALGLGLLALAWISGAEGVALSAAVVGGLAAPSIWYGLGASATAQGHAAAALWLATPAWLAALAYPLFRGARGRGERLPFLGAALSSGMYLLVARKALLAQGAGPYIGALPLGEAVLLLPHLRLLLNLEPPSERDTGRLALVAASMLALVTVAIPLQLDRQWWTIGWALQAAALAWLWRRIPHPGLLAWACALLAASFVRLLPFLNPWILEYHARGQAPVWNWYLYAYLLVAGAHLAAAWLLSRGQDRLLGRGPRLSTLAGSGGAVLLFTLLHVEIADFWSAGERITFRFSAGLAPDLSYTIGWAVFAVGLLAAGVALRLRGPRIAAIALLAATVLKAFLHDLARLTGLYRVASLAGLAVSLALVAVVLQRFVLRGGPRPSQAPAPPPPPPSPESP